ERRAARDQRTPAPTGERAEETDPDGSQRERTEYAAGAAARRRPGVHGKGERDGEEEPEPVGLAEAECGPVERGAVARELTGQDPHRFEHGQGATHGGDRRDERREARDPC